MALACTLGGFADSNLKFSEFFGNNHTISIRYLMQYPLGYVGAFFTVNGTGKYFVGQGDFKSLGIGLEEGKSGVEIPGITNLLIVVGDVFFNHPAPANGWHHVALVRSGSEMQVFIDGEPVRLFQIPTQDLPVGTVRFGRSSFDLPSGIGGQFYGLLDDFALFDKALPVSRIKELSNAKRLTGEEHNLQVGYVFREVEPTSLKPRLRRQLTHTPAAPFREVSDSRNSILDLPQIPLPLNPPMHLPFAPGEVWHVAQGYGETMSHNGYAAFCWDFARHGAIGGSEGEMIYSASPGRVRAIEQRLINPTEKFNFVSVRQEGQFCCDYLHIEPNSALVDPGQEVDFGTQLALVGDIGVEGRPHLHMAVSNGENSGKLFLTKPAAFSNYEAEIDGEWKLIIRGIPKTDQRVRRPADEGPIRYTAAWERGIESEIQMYGVTYEQYRARYDSIWDDDWRLAVLQTVSVDNQPRYTAVWRRKGGSEFQLYGATKSELHAENRRQEGKGWRMDLLTSYVEDEEEHFTGVWRPSNAARSLLLGVTRHEFDVRDAQERKNGFVFHGLNTHTIGGGTRFSVLWRRSNETEVTFIDRTESSYRREYDSRREFGFRLKMLSVNVINGQPVYSGSWLKHSNTVEEELLHDVSYGDLRARYDVLWQTGWRLKLLEPYA